MQLEIGITRLGGCILDLSFRSEDDRLPVVVEVVLVSESKEKKYGNQNHGYDAADEIESLFEGASEKEAHSEKEAAIEWPPAFRL